MSWTRVVCTRISGDLSLRHRQHETDAPLDKLSFKRYIFMARIGKCMDDSLNPTQFQIIESNPPKILKHLWLHCLRATHWKGDGGSQCGNQAESSQKSAEVKACLETQVRWTSSTPTPYQILLPVSVWNGLLLHWVDCLHSLVTGWFGLW